MSERLDKVIINEERYKNLLGMLNSSEGDQLVALECIKRLDKQRNYVAIAFLRKDSKCSQKLWEDTCNGHLQYQYSLGIPYTRAITMANIYEALSKEPKYNKENGAAFTARYIDFLKENLIKLDFVESIEINVKIKGYE